MKQPHPFPRMHTDELTNARALGRIMLQRMRESEVSLGRMQQPGSTAEDRELERERERWSLLRAARDEADRSLTLAANLADKEAALAHAHATIKEVTPVTGICAFVIDYTLR